jgi:hypothetical protein
LTVNCHYYGQEQSSAHLAQAARFVSLNRSLKGVQLIEVKGVNEHQSSHGTLWQKGALPVLQLRAGFHRLEAQAYPAA